MVTHFRALGAWLKPSWSPDGKRLVFTVNRHGGEGGSPNVYVVGINGSSAPTKITGKGVDEEPSWSSDGERIVFARASANNNHNVFVMNADGSHQIRLTGSTTDDTSPMWSPDGTQIVFTRTRGRDWDIPTGDIYVMDTDGSNIRRLTRTRNNAGPSWQPVRR